MILDSKLFGFLNAVLHILAVLYFVGHCVSGVCGNYTDYRSLFSKSFIDLSDILQSFVSSMRRSLGVSTKIDAQSFLVDQKVPVHGFTQIDALMQIVVSTKCN